WFQPHCSKAHWLAFTTLLAVGLTVYSIATRFWILAAAGQIFLVVSGWEFLAQLANTQPDWYLALTPIAGLALLSTGVGAWFARQPDTGSTWSEPVRQTALFYRWAALLMSLVWVHNYIPERERFWVLALAGAAVLAWSGWRRQTEGLIMSAILTVAGFGFFWFHLHRGTAVYVPNLLAILLLFAQQHLVRRLDTGSRIPTPFHSAAIWLAAATLWLFVSRWVLLKSGGFYLTASWAALAFLLFGAGFLLRERVHRWSGLTVLALALGRAGLIDVWRLETIYRILSFMALGIVLLLIGLIYSKYQEKIREWL
ncbi:MAG: DUF2339 domain-containing protein, partial [Pedosphaera parvula]|nr:DUF2339 domain-containing protein [Pedosphaera parvula]